MSAEFNIDVWTWTLTPPFAVLARLTAHLAPEEEARAGRYLNPHHGNQFRAGRGRLREILASYVDQPPASLELTTNPHGKPALASAMSISFNLSHTGDVAALAVTRASVASLGIDIERIRPIERDVASRFFSAAEVTTLEAVPPEDRTEAFYRCWTRKEAVVKALGDGLGYPLDAFDVSLTAAAPPMLLRLADRPVSELARWRLLHLAESDLSPGVIGAIALEADGPMPTVRLTWYRQ